MAVLEPVRGCLSRLLRVGGMQSGRDAIAALLPPHPLYEPSLPMSLYIERHASDMLGRHFSRHQINCQGQQQRSALCEFCRRCTCLHFSLLIKPIERWTSILQAVKNEAPATQRFIPAYSNLDPINCCW